MPVVILGSGIIALATAHYILLQSPSTKIYIIEPSATPFPGASSKAAGFLAKDWFKSAVAPLAELSFALHRKLAQEHNGAQRWGYAASTGISLEATDGRRGEDWLLEGTSRATAARAREAGVLPEWIVGGGGRAETISGPGTTAQVEPKRLCGFLYETLVEKGVMFHLGAQAERITTKDGVITGVEVINHTGAQMHLSCEQLLIACGAWSSDVFSHIFPSARISMGVSALAGYSLTVRSSYWSPPASASADCHAIFTAEGGWAPELFSRACGDIYLGGLNPTNLPLPKHAGEESIIGGVEMASMKAVAEKLLGEVEYVGANLCFRPVTEEGRPIVCGLAKEAGVEGVWVAAGHGPWGISMSLGTGRVIAQMIARKETEVDVGGLGFC